MIAWQLWLTQSLHVTGDMLDMGPGDERWLITAGRVTRFWFCIKPCPYHCDRLISKAQTSREHVLCVFCWMVDFSHCEWFGKLNVHQSTQQKELSQCSGFWLLVLVWNPCIQGNKIFFPCESDSERVFYLKMNRVSQRIAWHVWGSGKANLPQGLKCDILKRWILKYCTMHSFYPNAIK